MRLPAPGSKVLQVRNIPRTFLILNGFPLSFIALRDTLI
jgi:hypothetical protein